MHASDGIAAWRWWTLAELDSTAEVVWPSGLADLIRKHTHQALRPGQPAVRRRRTGGAGPATRLSIMGERWLRR